MKETKKYIVLEWTDYRREKNGGIQHGPATTYHDKDAIDLVMKFDSEGKVGLADVDLEGQWNDTLSVENYIRQRVEPSRVCYY